MTSAQLYSKHPAFRAAHADKREELGNGYVIERKLIGYAYGVTQGTSTPHYYWNLYLNGARVDSSHKRTPLVVGAKADNYR